MIVRDGITRTVLLVGDFAVKVPNLRYKGYRWRGFLRGILANMQERDLATIGEPYCPVLASVPGGFLIVMRRARVMSDADFERFDFDGFVNRPDGSLVAVERKADSLGWLDGRVVAIDYGGFAI